jgi:hypothetical protein
MNWIFLLTTTVVTSGVVASVVYEWLCRFSERTANDVLPFLQKIDLETLWGTFHPDAEAMLREQLSPKEFKQVQWKRFHLAIHYCEMLANNSRVLQGWTRYERKRGWRTFTPALKETITELRNTCMQCRLATFVIRLRLRWWLLKMALLPWTAPPSFKSLLGMGSAEMISFYDKVREMAESFSLAYGDDYHEKLMAVL